MLGVSCRTTPLALEKASFASFLKEINISGELMKYDAKGVKWISLLSLEYPEQLRQIYIPPIVLFYKRC